MKEKLLSPSNMVAECINVPHWDQWYLGEFRELNLWHWRSHPSVVPAGLMYPPGTIKFYVPLNTAHIQGRELFLQSLIDKPFGDDIDEAPEPSVTLGRWDSSDSEGPGPLIS